MAGYVNGGGMRNGSEGGNEKVASLEDARRRAAERTKAEKSRERATRLGSMTARDWIIGALFIAMAFGMIWHWISPLAGATGATR
ncbi:MAG: hypothetical protein AB7E81_18785 [Hyphomicrobiaceae bacterium]